MLDIARDGREAGQLRLSLAPNQRCVFGRQPGSCDIVLEHLSISRQHAHLSMDLNGRCFITDMGSGDFWLQSLSSGMVMHIASGVSKKWLLQVVFPRNGYLPCVAPSKYQHMLAVQVLLPLFVLLPSSDVSVCRCSCRKDGSMFVAIGLHAHIAMLEYIRNKVAGQGSQMVAGHGTNVDGLWLRAKAPRGLQVGSVIKFGASSRSYTVRPLVLFT